VKKKTIISSLSFYSVGWSYKDHAYIG